MSNIAEGFELRTNKEIVNFFFIAKSSCGEVRSMLHLAKKLKYITVEQYENNLLLAIEISRIISRFIKSL